MIDFATLQGLSIPEGAVVQIERNGVVLWALQVGEQIVLEVAKVGATTYAAETTYNNEKFILLDIYPRTNGKVRVTYAGVTKIITDTSGADNPNAQQVFFGTFNGVSDAVETPDKGTLKITGDCAAFACGTYQTGSKSTNVADYNGVTAIRSFGEADYIPDYAFGNELGGCSNLTEVETSPRIKKIGKAAFMYCTRLARAVIADGAEEIGSEAFGGCTKLAYVEIPATVKKIAVDGNTRNPFYGNTAAPIVAAGNTAYKVEGNCLVEIDTQRLIAGCDAYAAIPDGIVTVAPYAIWNARGLVSITVPATVETVGERAFYNNADLAEVTFLGTTPPTFGSTPFATGSGYVLSKIVVPKGCSAAYKAVSNLSGVSSLIVEES